MADGDNERSMESWPEYRRLVLAELVRLNNSIVALDQKLDAREADHRRELTQQDDENRKEMAFVKADVLTLKLKASMWGAVAGAAGSFIVSVIVAMIAHGGFVLLH